MELVKPTIEIRNQIFLASKIKQEIALEMMDLLLVLLEKGVLCVKR